MITALQNFISRKGKPFFFLLLIVVVVSFVLYLSQGTSIFDFISDPNREKKIFYGVDMNDPDERRVLSITNQVAADLGAIVSPTKEILDRADARYFNNLQNQLRAAYQPENRDKLDQEVMQNMFGYMQSWRNFPDAVKVMAIARSGDYDLEFSESSIQAKLIMDKLASDFDFLPAEINHPGINNLYHDFISKLNPALSQDQNRSTAFTNLSRFRGVSPRDVDAILYDHFRAHQIDRVFSSTGYTLATEAAIDLHRDQFAWDAEAILVNSDEFEFSLPVLAALSFKDLPKVGDKVEIQLDRPFSFEFVKSAKDANGTKFFVSLGKDIVSTVKSLKSQFTAAFQDVVIQVKGKQLLLSAPESSFSNRIPVFKTNFKNADFDFELKEDLLAFHDVVKNNPEFVRPARTFASMVSFDSNNFYTPPAEPSEERMRSYFDRNRVLFEPLPPAPSPDEIEDLNGSKGPDGEKGVPEANASSKPEELTFATNLLDDQNQSEITFEDVRDEVKQRIVESDEQDAKRESEELAKEAALKFLEDINAFGDRSGAKFQQYSLLRESEELKSLLKASEGKLKPISFTQKDMSMKSRILGLERRESERRANRDPLFEVESLNERLFFTRSIRKTKDGFAVFILDRRTKEKPSEFQQVNFSSLYTKFLDQEKAKAFGLWVDQKFEELQKQNDEFKLGQKISIQTKSAQAVRSGFDRRSSKLRSQIQDLQDERTIIADLERESNATKPQVAKKKELDQKIEELRDAQADLNKERSLANRLLEVVGTMSPDNLWVEQERTEDTALFTRLSKAYTLGNKTAAPEKVEVRARELEFSKSENSRSQLLANLIEIGLSQ